MKKFIYSTFGLAVFVLALSAVRARANDDDRRSMVFRAELVGAHEVPLSLTAARGQLQLTVSDDELRVHFVLRYQGLETPVTASHIHVGQPNVNGAVTVFFCGGGGRPACPREGTVEGDFDSSNVGGITSQQLPAGDLARLLRAIRAGDTYANLHTMDSPGGEIRGQIMPVRRHEGDD
jgi:hypothetical protein